MHRNREKIKEQVDEKISEILEEGINHENLEALGDLVDIHKDVSNEEYWEKKEEVMEMNRRGYGSEYGNYGRRGVPGSGRGRYSRRGMNGRYQGENMLEDMHEMYRDYSDGREEYGRGNYGAKNETMKSLECMLESVVDFMEMLKKDANSQEEVELIQRYAEEIGDM